MPSLFCIVYCGTATEIRHVSANSCKKFPTNGATQVLLKNGADPDKRDAEGKTALEQVVIPLCCCRNHNTQAYTHSNSLCQLRREAQRRRERMDDMNRFFGCSRMLINSGPARCEVMVPCYHLRPPPARHVLPPTNPATS